MGTYAGIDLHSSNNYIGIMDQDHKRLFGRRLPNDLDDDFNGFGTIQG